MAVSPFWKVLGDIDELGLEWKDGFLFLDVGMG
jgi:hypothetical protein